MNLSQLLTRVVRHSAIYGLADFVGKAIGFLLVPLYTRTLTQEAFGQLQILFLFQTFGIMTVGVGQVGTLLRYHPKARDEAERRHLLRGVLAIAGTACGIFLLLGVGLAVPTSNAFLGGPELAGTFRLFLIGIVARVLGDIPLTLLRIEERSTRYGAGTLFRLLVSLVLIIYFVVVRDMGVVGVVLGDVIASTALLVSLLPVLARHLAGGRAGDPRPEFSRRAFLAFGWPYMVVNLGAFGLIAIDRLFLAGSSRIVEAGIYSLGGKLASLLNVLVLSPFTLVWGPMSFRLAEDNETGEAQRIFSRLLTYFAFVLYVLGLGLFLFSPEILALAGPPEYASADQVVPLLLISMIVFGFYKHFQVGLAVTGRTRSIASSFVLAATVNLAANALLVPRYGMLGAAIATCASYVLMCGFILIRVQAVYPVPYEWRRIAGGALAAALLAFPRGLIGSLPLVPAIGVKLGLLGLLPVFLYLGLPRSERVSAQSWFRQLW